MDQEKFQQILKQKLDASGMSAKEFADKARISKPLVYFYLTGQRTPTEATMTRIAEALNTPVDDLNRYARKGLGRPAKS